MNLVREELRHVSPGRPSAVTIGKFDGVHRGHRAVLQRLRDEAVEFGLASVAIILHPSPYVVLHPERKVAYLTGLEDRVDLIREIGIDVVAVVTFTSEVASLSARQFAEALTETLDMRRLLLGPGFALGRGREGSPEVLAAIGADLGFSVDVCSALEDSGRVVSSSAVREALSSGEMETVADLLGRPYSLRGPVVHGAERGRTIGFPTANIAVGADLALPPYGVYATRAFPGSVQHMAATNIGVRPTFDNGAPSIEVFILDFSGDLYGQELRIELVKKLRGEMRFGGIDELTRQMNLDIAESRAVLA